MSQPVRLCAVAVVLSSLLACGDEPLVGDATGTCLGTSWSTQVPLTSGWWALWQPALADNGEVTLLVWNQHELVDGAVDHPNIVGVFVDSSSGAQRGEIFAIRPTPSVFDAVRVVVAGDGGFLVGVLDDEGTQTMRIEHVDDSAVITNRRLLRDRSGLGWSTPVVGDDDGMAIVHGNFDVLRADADNTALPSLPGFDDLTGYCLAAVRLPTGALFAWCMEWGLTPTSDIPFIFMTSEGGEPQRIEFAGETAERLPQLVVVDEHVLLVTTIDQRLRARTFDFDGTAQHVVDIAEYDDDVVLTWESDATSLSATGDHRAVLGYRHYLYDDVARETLTTGTITIDDDGVPAYVEGASVATQHHSAAAASGGGATTAWMHEGFKLFPWETGPHTWHIERRCGVGDDDGT